MSSRFAAEFAAIPADCVCPSSRGRTRLDAARVDSLLAAGHLISRAVRFWRPGHGRDEAVLCALASVPVASDTVEEPGSREELARQLTVERAVSRAHLATVKAQFYDRDWRRENNHDGIHPEDHLWWATAGYLDLDDAIAALDG